MRITVTTESSSIKNIIPADDFSKLISGCIVPYNLTIQNLGETKVYIERKDPATVENGYVLFPMNEVDIRIENIDDLNIISENANNDNIRIITT